MERKKMVRKDTDLWEWYPNACNWDVVSYYRCDQAEPSYHCSCLVVLVQLKYTTLLQRTLRRPCLSPPSMQLVASPAMYVYILSCRDSRKRVIWLLQHGIVRNRTSRARFARLIVRWFQDIRVGECSNHCIACLTNANTRVHVLYCAFC